jgi:hypothetical protein
MTGLVFSRPETDTAIGVSVAVPITVSVPVRGAGVLITVAGAILFFFVFPIARGCAFQGSSGFRRNLRNSGCDRARGGGALLRHGFNRDDRCLGPFRGGSVFDDCGRVRGQFRGWNYPQFTLQAFSCLFCVRFRQEGGSAQHSSNSCKSSHKRATFFQAGLLEHGVCQSCSMRTPLEELGTQRLKFRRSHTNLRMQRPPWELSPMEGD